MFGSVDPHVPSARERTFDFALHTLSRVQRMLGLGPFGADRVNCVHFDAINSVVLQPTNIVGFHSRCRFWYIAFAGGGDSMRSCSMLRLVTLCQGHTDKMESGGA